MKATSTITDFILVKADTNSDWDECQFALIHCTEEWKEQMQQRLKALQSVEDEHAFVSIAFYDTSVDFYRTDEDEQPDIHALLNEKEWSFVELDKNEREALLQPENRLVAYRLSLYRHGTAIYTAHGKHSGEEFYTAEFSVSQILNHNQETVGIVRLY
ncbi:MAG TPA: hypothetical protein PKC47_04340 [Petrimonas sp.]|nr:hypothetical protein [Petrimonas sp.]